MATITASNEKVIRINKFLGLHESPDGDNKLKLGEATVCKNFQVTINGNLKKRAGTTLKYTLGSNKPIMGMWHGFVNKREITVAACDGHLWLLMDQGVWLQAASDLGAYATTNDVFMFGFDEKMYCLNGSVYAVLYYASSAWHFDSLSSGSAGYRPLVAITVPPEGGGELLEQVNKLNGLRRLWISPDGESYTYQLPETGLQSIDYVKNLATGSYLAAGTDYSTDTANGTVTFTVAPDLGVNSYEIGWIYGTNYASQVAAMRYAELYAGTQDNRVFVYGNGSNMAFYSGLDYDGKQRADYFPDLNVVDVGDSNTPISGMIRHYGKLMAFKNPVGCYSIEYGVVTLADTTLTPAFYSTPLNKIIGNEAPGQVQLVLNAPRTLSASHLFEWRNGSSYAANISIDERQAKRLSDRIYATLRAMDFSKVHCYDDNHHQEYYIVDENGNALVHNYAADAWYYYTGVDARILLEINGDLYIGTKTGKILLLDETAMGDWIPDDVSATASEGLTVSVTESTFKAKVETAGTYTFNYTDAWDADLAEYGIEVTGTPAEGDTIVVAWAVRKPIDCKWDSGSMDFGASNMRKYSALMWVGLKSEPDNEVDVTVQTDRSTENTVITADPPYTSDIPRITRCKVKVKKFVYYKLLFLSNASDVRATVVDVDIKVRATSQAK
jgi:hypothetical protein